MPETMRDQLEEQWGKSEGAKEEEERTPTPEELMQPVKEEEGAESKEGEEVEGKEEESKEEETKEGEDREEEEESRGEEGEEIKAPASWTPKAKEHWKSLPSDLKQEIVERERSFSVGIQRYAEAAKFAQQVQETLRPFHSVMAAEGANELQAIHNLAQYAATMRLGNTEQKAGTIAELIKAYDVDIETLDNILSGEGGSNPQSTQIEQLLDKRLAPINQFIQQVEQGRSQTAQRTSQEIAQEIDNFANSAEFFYDVRNDIADILELKAKKGQKMTLEEAYNQAIALRPDIQEIVESRNRKKEIEERNRRMGKKEHAASSVGGGTHTPQSGVEEATSVRGAIQAAIDSHSQDV